jgi:hypothetical protein
MKPSVDRIKRFLGGALATLLACLLFVAISQARGDTVPMAYTTTTVYTSAGVLTTEATQTVTSSPFTSSSSSGTNTGSDGVNSYTANGSAVVNANGSLGASSTLSVSGPEIPNPGLTIVGSQALLTDELTVTAAGIPTGTLGTFDATVTITGSTSSLTGTNFSDVIVNVGYGMAETFESSVFAAGNPSDNAVGAGNGCLPGSISPASSLGTVTCMLSFSLPMTYGDPFELATDLDAYVIATPGPGGTEEGGTSDFIDTAQITSIALDANGNPVTNFNIASASGLDYTAKGVVATPEPSSLLLLGTGLVIFILAAKRTAWTSLVTTEIPGTRDK